MKSAVIVFPGSNRERDMIAALTEISGDAAGWSSGMPTATCRRST